MIKKRNGLKKNKIKKLWAEGKATVGTWLVLGSPIVAEILANMDFDWVVIDTEHGSIDISMVQHIIQAISATDTVPIVRVPWNHPMVIKRALDAGALGLIIPMVNTREEAIQAVRATRYPPLGDRSYGGPRARLYGGVDYFEHANDEIVLIIQIEHIDAVNRVDDILSVDGIDGYFIGPSDLAISVGLKPGLDNTDQRHVSAVSSIIASGKRHGVAGGIQVGSPEAVNERIAQGFQFIALSSDEGFMRSAATSAITKIRKVGNCIY